MTLHVKILGQGPDLVLVHGWGMHGGVWQPVAEALAQSFRLHVVDLPGLGRSAAVTPYTLGALAEALAHVAPSRAAVCGWSLGGQVALRWALERPDQVERLMLVGATPRFVRGDDWSHGVEPEVFRQFAAQVGADYRATLSRFLTLQAQGGDVPRETLRQLREVFFRRPLPASEVLRAGLDILLATDLRAELASVETPTLVLHGGHDRLAPVAAGRWLAAALPEARAEICEAASHAPFLSHPGWFVARMREFLDG